MCKTTSLQVNLCLADPSWPVYTHYIIFALPQRSKQPANQASGCQLDRIFLGAGSAVKKISRTFRVSRLGCFGAFVSNIHIHCARPISEITSRRTTRMVGLLITKNMTLMWAIGAGSTKASRSRRCCCIAFPHFDGSGSRAALAKAFVQVWADALDLTQAGGDGDVECYFHYTTELGFRNITHASKAAVEVFVLPSELLCLNAIPFIQPVALRLGIHSHRLLSSQAVKRPMRGGEKARRAVTVS